MMTKTESENKDDIVSENEVWYIISSYFHRFGIVRHQLESYDNFMTTVLPHIIQETSEVVVKNGKETHAILAQRSIQRFDVARVGWLRS